MPKILLHVNALYPLISTGSYILKLTALDDTFKVEIQQKQIMRRKKNIDAKCITYLLITETPHNLLQKSTPIYTEPNSHKQ